MNTSKQMLGWLTADLPPFPFLVVIIYRGIYKSRSQICCLHWSFWWVWKLIQLCFGVTKFYYLSCSVHMIDLAAPELIRNFQQQQQKAADTLLKKAKELCDKHGVLLNHLHFLSYIFLSLISHFQHKCYISRKRK